MKLSHPSWVCGLKQVSAAAGQHIDESHPSWVCGLKPSDVSTVHTIASHTLRGCVD